MATELETKVQAFKNGFALISKTYILAKHEIGKDDTSFATYNLGKPTSDACYGTLWIRPPPKTHVAALRVAKQKKTKPRQCLTITELLKANVGRKVGVKIKEQNQMIWAKGVVEAVTSVPKDEGRSLFGNSSAPPSGQGLLAMKVGAGDDAHVLTLPIGEVLQVKGFDEFSLLVDSETAQVEEKELLLEYTGEGGKATLSYLRKDINWAPSYLWSLHESAKRKVATVTASATVMNDTTLEGNIDVIECVVGFPQMKYTGILDPLVSDDSVDAFVVNIGNPNTAVTTGARRMRPPRRREMQMQQMSSTFSNIAPMQQMSHDVDIGSSSQEGKNEEDVDASDDVHFHTFQNVYLPAKGRLSLPYFTTYANYADVYRAKVPENPPIGRERQLEVWHALKVENKTDKPWTTAPVVIMKGDRFIAQGIVKYTPVGENSLVDMSKALNVRASFEQKTINGGHEDKSSSHWYSSISSSPKNKLGHNLITTTITIFNGKYLEINLIVDFTASGELMWTKPTPPNKNVEKVSRQVVGSTINNATRELQWELAIKPKSRVTIEFQTKMYYATR